MNIFWLINCHNPEHDRITCNCTIQSIVASVHCFSAEGLHFSSLVLLTVAVITVYSLEKLNDTFL